MPAPVALSPAVHTSGKTTGAKSRAPPPSRKTRVVKRRGRAKDALDSDDEIEREVGTDSETDDDDESSVDSASDSDTEPASEDVLPNGHARILTPSLTQSSAEMVVVAQTDDDDPPAFFSGARSNWSEMVADENVNGPADLPVIDFADFGDRTNRRPSRKVQKGSKRSSGAQKTMAPASAPSVVASSNGDQNEVPSGEEQIASSSRQPSATLPKRVPGQTARQVYQQRLEKDPSYVPTVGEFWGHDDRLLDKDLRSLSGWWRGRWQGRGRGGFGRGFARGRGRGRFFGPQQPHGAPNGDVPVGQEDALAVETAPPIERAWTHDGFEEMKKKEENRRPVHNQPSVRGAGGFRGGRGTFTPGPRAGGGPRSGPSPMRPNSGRPLTQGRTWFTMKPECVWTKQHDSYLHLNPAVKPRAGQGQSIQVKLPGATGQTVRVSTGPVRALKSSAAKTTTSSILGSDDGEKKFVVRLPKSVSREQQLQREQSAVAEPSTTIEELPVDDAFTVRPRHVTRPTIPDFETAATVPIVLSASHSVPLQIADTSLPDDTAPPAAQPQPEPDTLHGIQTDEQGWIQAQVPTSQAQHQEHQADNLEVPAAGDGRLLPPVLPPIQTSFTPVPQPSPSYGSPYGYPPGLPPGVAMNQQGVPYEVSTGRAFYYQPPQQLYNPRPIMHTHMAPPGIPFVPGHMRHMTTSSPDFIAPSHTPPVNGFIDPSTGAPIFSVPRQSSRIEIRSPSQLPDNKAAQKTVRRPSALRTTATAFEPQQSTVSNDQGQSYFPNVTAPQNNGLYVPVNGVDGGRLAEDVQHQQQQTMEPAVMGYPPYQQQYYYPEQYGYSTYMDMSQVAQYDLYPQDPHATSQQPIYY